MATEAVILAAGNGSRLVSVHGHRSKCLVEVGGRPLIRHQLSALRLAGVDRVVVVAGFDSDRVRETVAGDAEIVINERWAETNSMCSFLAARNHVSADLVVLNSDVLFPTALLYALRGILSSAIAFDSASQPDDEQMKVAVENGRVVELSKSLALGRSAGENLGVIRLTRAAALGAFECAAELVAEGRTREWLAAAVNRIAGHHHLAAFDVSGMPWTEIDYPRDLERARTLVWPAIQRWTLDLAGERTPAAMEA